MDEKTGIEAVRTSVKCLYNVMGLDVDSDLQAVRDDFAICVEADLPDTDLEKACLEWLDNDKNRDTFAQMVKEKFGEKEKTKETIER